MTAYLISEVTIEDEHKATKYRELAAASIARHGGIYLARGGKLQAIEGTIDFQLAILVAFPTMEDAEHLYSSSEYTEALSIARTALRRRLFLVEGVRCSFD